MKNDHKNVEKEEQGPGYEFTEQELLLGKEAAKLVNILCLIALFCCIGGAIFVFFSVPASTSMPYSGRWATGPLPMQVVLLLVPVFLLMIWRDGRKSDAHHMTNRGRVIWYFVGPAMIAACVVGQAILMKDILTFGGFFNR